MLKGCVGPVGEVGALKSSLRYAFGVRGRRDGMTR